jgi:hypothetical protein
MDVAVFTRVGVQRIMRYAIEMTTVAPAPASDRRPQRP